MKDQLKQVAQDIAFKDNLRKSASKIDDAMEELFDQLEGYGENQRAELVYKYVIEHSALSWLWDKQSEINKSKV